MNSMTRLLASFCAAVAALAVVLPTAPASAQENIAYVSATGNGVTCSAAQPCGLFVNAINNNIRIVCLDGNASGDAGSNVFIATLVMDIDCPLGVVGHLQFNPVGGNTPDTVRIKHLSFRSSLAFALAFQAGGTLILEDCDFTDSSGAAVDIEPNGPLNLVINNSRISNNGSGILLKPAGGGSINATLNHVTISQNTGAGIKIDTTNGTVTIDIADSVVSNNGGNGINAVGNAGGQGIVNVKNSVIAKNGVAGVQANGANAAALIATTLLDQNAAGATSIVGGGHVSTYGNNQIVGGAGSGFNQMAGLQ
jgi:hypothetical protein